MASKISKSKIENRKSKQIENIVVENKIIKDEKCSCKNCGIWAKVGWVALLFGGMAHMLPEQMAPLMSQSAFGVSLQSVVGIISMILGLYFLLGDEKEESSD